MRKSLLDSLFPRTRRNLLSTLLLRPDRWWYLSDLAKHLGVPPSSLQRELSSLASGDIVVRRKDGQRVYYRANKQCPILEELQSILVKTAGVADVIGSVVDKARGKIDVAFIYGSLARAEELSTSDVDLMIIGDSRLSDLAPGLRRAERLLGREVNVTLYSSEELSQKSKSHDAFIKTVMAEPKIFVKGDENELQALAR